MVKIGDWIRRSPVLVRVVIGLLAILLISSPLSLPLYRWEYLATQGKTVIWTPIFLFGVFVLLLPHWLQQVHRCAQPWRALGMHDRNVWWQAWLQMFAVGTLGVMLLYGIQILLGWSDWVALSATTWPQNLWLGLLVGIGVGLAEELIFRGWLLFELEQNYAATPALMINAGVFAIAHYLRPISEIIETWPQFMGLFLLGCALVWARRIPTLSARHGTCITTLGPAAGLHGGLVFTYYQFDVNDLLIANGTVPNWVTGVDGNPLAGLLGLTLLGAIACGTFVASHRPVRHTNTKP